MGGGANWNVTAWLELEDGTKFQSKKNTAVAGEPVSITFEPVAVGTRLKVKVELVSATDSSIKYSGTSDLMEVASGENSVSLELSPVDAEPEEDTPPPDSEEEEKEEPETQDPEQPSYDPLVGLSWDSKTSTLTIYNEAGLKNFRDIVNGNVSSNPITVDGMKFNTQNRSINAVLANDITLTEAWVPIADNSSDPYSGTFDGRKYTISGLTITNSSSKPVGFFGSVGKNTKDTTSGKVKNLTVEGTISTNYYAGGIAGCIDGATIEYCVNKIAITNIGSGMQGITGGIVGYVSSTRSFVTGCVNLGAIQGVERVGGILGASYTYSVSDSGATVDKCINIGSITTQGGTDYSGGIYGNAAITRETITNCLNLGSITSSSNKSAGITCNEGVYMNIRYCLSAGDMSNIPEDRQPLAFWIQDDDDSLNYYNSNIISTTASAIEGIGKTTAELKVATPFDTTWGTNWSFESGRYPVPNIQENIPSPIWNEIVAKARE